MTDDIIAAANEIVAATVPRTTVTIELTLDVDDRRFWGSYESWCYLHGRIASRSLLGALEDVYAFYTEATPGVRLKGTEVA